MRKSLLLCALLASVLVLAGCVGPVTAKRAQKIAVETLKEKYGGEFVVKNARSDIDVNESTASMDYELEVYAREKRLTTHVTVSSDGQRVGDDLEELMYADRVENEVRMVPCAASGWVLKKTAPTFHSYVPNQQGSADFEDYKRDAEKVELSVDTVVDGHEITSAEVKAVAASLYDYVDTLQSIGYRVRLFIDCNGLLERIDSIGRDDTFDEKQIEETLRSMGAGTKKEEEPEEQVTQKQKKTSNTKKQTKKQVRKQSKK